MIKIVGKASKNNISSLIDLEYDSLNNHLTVQQEYNKQILIFLKNFVNNIQLDTDDTFSEKIQSNINSCNLNLKKIKFNIDSLNSLLKSLLRIKDSEISCTTKVLKDKVEEYNEECKPVLNKVFINTTNIQNFIQKTSFMDLSEFSNESNTKKRKSKRGLKKSTDIDTENLLEHTLLISETQEKVFLPYTISELDKFLNNEKYDYSNYNEVIENEFTKPLDYYKYSPISRFKEAYNLIFEREKGSKKDAISLGLELFANFNIHPAIITACKNLNELDVYLSCLEYNELNDFHFFKIEYEMAPAVIKSFKKVNDIIKSDNNETIQE